MIKISISGKHMSVGEALQFHINEKMQHILSKYLNSVTSAEVFIHKKIHYFCTDILVHEGTGLGIIKANSGSDDAYTSFDTALIKIEKQLRRYSRKIKNHYKKSIKDNFEFISGKNYIVSNISNNADESDSIINEDQEPLIIAEKTTNIEKLTVSEAIMKMDLSNKPAYMFVNKVNNRINFVYHRHDGNISWVDPEW